jgi:hypothetical protein
VRGFLDFRAEYLKENRTSTTGIVPLLHVEVDLQALHLTDKVN